MNDGVAAAARTGIPHAVELIGFADAVVGREPEEIGRARDSLDEAAGPQAVVDAAAIAANFQRMVRIADGCGIPLDAPMQAIGREAREELELDRFAASANTPKPGLAGRAAAPLLRAFAPLMQKIVPRLARRQRSRT